MSEAIEDAVQIAAERSRLVHSELHMKMLSGVGGFGLGDAQYQIALLAGMVASLASCAAVTCGGGDDAAMLAFLHEQIDQSWCDSQRIMAGGQA